MDCSELKETGALAVAAEGGPEREETREVRAHVRGCGQCREELDSMRAVIKALNRDKAVPVPEPGAEFWGGLAGSVRSELGARERKARVINMPAAGSTTGGQSRRHGRRAFVSFASMAAAVLALVVIGLYGSWQGRGPETPHAVVKGLAEGEPAMAIPYAYVTDPARDHMGGDDDYGGLDGLDELDTEELERVYHRLASL